MSFAILIVGGVCAILALSFLTLGIVALCRNHGAQNVRAALDFEEVRAAAVIAIAWMVFAGLFLMAIAEGVFQ